MERTADEPVTHDERPTRAGTVGALAGCLTLLVLVSGSTPALMAAVFGTVCVGAGLWQATVEPVTLGVAALSGSVLLVGLGRTPLWLLSLTVLVVLVWGAARHAVRLGRQVGRAGRTVRVELAQSVAVGVVAVVGGGGGYLGFRSAAGSVSLFGVALLMASVVTVTLVLR